MPFSAAAWSSTGLTPVPLPDAPWNTTVPPCTYSLLLGTSDNTQSNSICAHPSFFTEKHAIVSDAWSSTGTLSSLPDAQWNATVPPVRLKFTVGKLSQPKCCHHNIHLFNKEHQFPSKQIQLVAAATQHGKNHRGFQGLTHLLEPIFLGLGKVVEESHLIP
ncbi:unnamed protein product [Sphagnum jensenii]|uniref:Uncharacterized protein n=1 Tax=Sphagnum jensenii TaxID=128206 RepID=A0ABP0XJJ4_9BRYO